MFKTSAIFLLIAVLGTVSAGNSFGAGAIKASSSGLAARLDAKTGNYQVSSTAPAWTFAGSLGVPLKHVGSSRGHDEAGEYQQLTFDWSADGKPMSGQVRIYNARPLAVFSQTCNEACEKAPAPFPAFGQLPEALHVFSYGQLNFAPPSFSANEVSTPWLMFDDHANAAIISPASHFMVASMFGDGHKVVASGLNTNLVNVPKGFTQQTLLAFGQGINKTWDVWGRGLITLQHATRPSEEADAVLKYLGYWTDNGAVYYYNYDLTKGYAGTLASLVDHYQQEQIPIRYLQLDSWWYYKTTTDADGKVGKDKKAEKLPAGEWNRYGGLLEYRAHSALFTNGLDAFQKSINLPLVTHNRWVDPASPYHERYRISGLAAVDPKWWDDIAKYLKTSGIATYEQDWLDHIYSYSPGFSSNVDTAEAFLDNMSRACREQGVTLQYCMAYPCYFLQGSRYENLTTIRTSGDRFNAGKWNNFLYTSRFASALGIWPWADVYMSTERDNVLLSTLSAGPVGVGDAIGTENKANLLHAVRSDGVIVKPDTTIVPLDSSYIADANKSQLPMVAATYTDHGGIKTEYLFAFNRYKKTGATPQWSPADLGLRQDVYLYDYFAGSGKPLGNHEPFSTSLNQNTSAFYVVAPVGKSGIAFLGDKDKFVGTGKQRISSLHDERGKLTVGVVLAENEKSVTLHGYAASAPQATVISAVDDPVQYDPATHYFTVNLQADTTTPVEKSGGDPVRQLTLVLSTQLK